jgi:creatinine amidohydrolase/Fe(II)-dependent formamide hydrolase-like protein
MPSEVAVGPRASTMGGGRWEPGRSETIAGVYELETLSARALRRLIDGGASIVVVPFGSIEHHGGHLAIGADSVLADAVGRAVAERLGAVLAPTFRVGCAQQHRQDTGTIMLRSGTLTEVAIEVAESLARQGFNLIVLVSTHGGNRAALDAAVDRLNAGLGGAVVCAPEGDVGPQPGAHSGEWLTSVMLALRPDLVELNSASTELATEVGAADAERGISHIERFVASIVEGARAAGKSR